MRRWMIMLLLFWLPQAQADDTELYEPAPPPDSAFVRVIGGNPGQEATPGLAGRSYGRLVFPAISDYRAIPSGERNFTMNGAKQPLTLRAGKFYSLLIADGGKAVLRQDAPLANPAKAGIYFYNLSDAAKAAVISPSHGNATIIEEIAPGEASSREINAVTLMLQIRAGGKAAKDFPEITLRRRRGMSLLLAGEGPDYQAIMVPNAVAR